MLFHIIVVFLQKTKKKPPNTAREIKLCNFLPVIWTENEPQNIFPPVLDARVPPFRVRVLEIRNTPSILEEDLRKQHGLYLQLNTQISQKSKH